MTFAFYLVHHLIFMLIDLRLVGASLPWEWGHNVVAAVANGFLAVVLFAGLDRFKRRM